ncbi:SMI1/KNR4 family protein, partial [Streptomyces sp. ICN988]|nr:SMI1/KNR4 family protein [Streptomyces sp. ICN988]
GTHHRTTHGTPRAPPATRAPEPVADLDPPGLAWLAEPGGFRGSFGGAYRCVWVEGVGPERLPELIGEEGAALSGPVRPSVVARSARRPHEREDEGVELWEDRAVVAVGRAGGAWSFAFDGYGLHHMSQLFRSPVADASAGGRAVVVWCEPGQASAGGRPDAFHLSVADGGEELYAFTLWGAEVERSGAIPEALDPDRLFRPVDSGQEGHLRALEALHGELGLSLPRFALTHGRLPTFTTRSWTRAPREGEGFAYLAFHRTRG